MKPRLILLVSLLLFGGVFWLVMQSQPNSPSPKLNLDRPETSDFSPFSPMAWPTSVSPRENLGVNRERVVVARVIDGDTVELEDGRRVRYIGIDTPETVDPRKAVQCFGREASAKNRELAEGKEIEMEKDVSETDKYGRLLRYIYVGDPSVNSGQAVFINDYLVRQGFAYSSSYPPDIKYQDQLGQAEKEARDNDRGLWSACGGEKTATAGGECQIKGNISSSGEKIYHRPDCPYWSKTVISEEKGERWFCSEEEARDAGWRIAQNCP